ncbi:unnamed protein product [Amoebophrya sp. A120]|nr:unnamed protein product [Amoebophrya sp. A120]|eukprot:GSA120T00004161001.1
MPVRVPQSFASCVLWNVLAIVLTCNNLMPFITCTTNAPFCATVTPAAAVRLTSTVGDGEGSFARKISDVGSSRVSSSSSVGGTTTVGTNYNVSRTYSESTARDSEPGEPFPEQDVGVLDAVSRADEGSTAPLALPRTVTQPKKSSEIDTMELVDNGEKLVYGGNISDRLVLPAPEKKVKPTPVVLCEKKNTSRDHDKVVVADLLIPRSGSFLPDRANSLSSSCSTATPESSYASTCVTPLSALLDIRQWEEDSMEEPEPEKGPVEKSPGLGAATSARPGKSSSAAFGAAPSPTTAAAPWKEKHSATWPGSSRSTSSSVPRQGAGGSNAGKNKPRRKGGGLALEKPMPTVTEQRVITRSDENSGDRIVVQVIDSPSVELFRRKRDPTSGKKVEEPAGHVYMRPWDEQREYGTMVYSRLEEPTRGTQESA